MSKQRRRPWEEEENKVELVAEVACEPAKIPEKPAVVEQKTCAKCNEWLQVGVCTRDGSRKKSTNLQCKAKAQGK